MRKINAFVFHHTGGAWGSINGKEVREFVLNEAHTWKTGWYPTMYHYLVALDGTVYHDADDSQVVPHCGLDHNEYWITNQTTLAVSAIGNLEITLMPDKQYYSILSVIKMLKKKYSQAFFKLHQELVATDCPGKNFPFQSLMKDLEVCMAYPDVDPKAWYFKAVAWAIQKGLLKGNEKGLFQPNKGLTRAEYCQSLYNQAERDGKL